MPFVADYPGAIVVEAANYGYGGAPNHPKTWGFHTPEEPADSYPSTPDYLATTDRDASYTYFDSYLGFIFQLAPEALGAYAHGLEGKPEPSWSDGTNLNLQSLSLSFEGRAATIHQTMPRGSPQWNAGVNLVAHRTKALGLNLGWSFQHKEVSIYRGDCGQWDQAAFIADVKAKMQEDDMPDPIIETPSGRRAQLGVAGKHPITGDEHYNILVAGGSRIVPASEAFFDDMFVVGSLTIAGLTDVMGTAGGGGLSEAQARQIVRQEIDKTKLTA